MLVNETSSKIPPIPFEAMKDAVLGKEYDLSVVIVSKEKIQSLNKQYRNIDESTDILSFPLDKESGEIFINLEETKKMAPDFDREYENFLGFLFIHGLVHLKGYDHGSTMENIEMKYRKVFKI